MSMPGFDFHFRCAACGATSEEYPLYVFSDIFRADLVLPAWSLRHRCWMTIIARLSDDQRGQFEADRDALVAFAASLSSEAMTVAVPQFVADKTSSTITVNVTPDPQCPHCGGPCAAIFGRPVEPEESPIWPHSAEEFDVSPISMVKLSVRAAMICRELGIRTLGQLDRARYGSVAEHKHVSDAVLSEFDSILARRPRDAD